MKLSSNKIFSSAAIAEGVVELGTLANSVVEAKITKTDSALLVVVTVAFVVGKSKFLTCIWPLVLKNNG